MAVIEPLTEGEAALYAILQDASGIDLAEFTWPDEEAEDGIWRAWPFQWKWWRCMDMQAIDQCARSVGKSMSIKARAFVFPHIHPNAEMVITAPEGTHVDAITDVIETAFKNTRLGHEILTNGRLAFRHRPFVAHFKNGARILGRLPQRTGIGVKGTHPTWLDTDEGQDYPEAGWVELRETLNRGHEGAIWRAHGVTRGVRDQFYLNTLPDSGWTVHKYAAMWKPTWTDEERDSKIKLYGGREDPDYRRNVLGEHGDEVSPLFVLHRLMLCVDSNEESTYNTDEYQYIELRDSLLLELGKEPLELLDFNPMRYDTYWAGMDVGYTNHPSEIVVFAEHNVKKPERDALAKLGKAVPMEGLTRLKLVCRIHLTRIRTRDQYDIIKYVIRQFNLKAFSMDKTGNGLPLFQLVEDDDDEHMAQIIKGYNFSGKILVDFDPSIELEFGADLDEQVKEAGINRNTVDYATDVLRHLVDDKRLWLPWDRDLISEFQGETYKITKTAMDQYGRREYATGKFHAFDACRMAALGWKQYAIEAFMKADHQEPVLDTFIQL